MVLGSGPVAIAMVQDLIKLHDATKELNMAVGPIQLIAIGFEDFTPTGEILPSLMEAIEGGAIRLIDLQFVSKDAGGNITSLEMSGLSEDETMEFGAVIGSLIGAGVDGEEGAFEGAIEGALAAASHSYGLTAADVQEVADSLEPGDAAALLLIEHTWAIDFRDAVADAGGYMMAQGFLTPDTLFLIGAELEAQAEAVDTIIASEMIQEEAAEQAATAVALSEMIQEEAVQRAIDALVAADLIEQAAIEDASEVVNAALEVEYDAVAEAAAVVEAAEEVEDEAIAEAEDAIEIEEEAEDEL